MKQTTEGTFSASEVINLTVSEVIKIYLLVYLYYFLKMIDTELTQSKALLIVRARAGRV